MLRLSSLAFGTAAAQMTGLGAEVLLAGGLATLVFGTIGVLASQGLGRLAGCSVLVSSGTLLAVVGMAGLGGGSPLVAAGLFYLVASTLGLSALYLMVELIEREQGAIAAMLTVTAEAYGLGDDEFDEADASGSVPAVPGATTVLGLCFAACALLLAGLPPLAGFLGKFAMLSAALGSGGLAAGGDRAGRARLHRARRRLRRSRRWSRWSREGIRTFWASDEDELPAVPLIEIAPVVAAARADRWR